MRRTTFALSFLMLASTALADEAMPRTITTSGSATVHVAPDEATLNFSVHTSDKDLAKAKKLNDEAAAEVLTFLKSLGMEETDIQSTFADSQAVYGNRDDNRQIHGPLLGFDVARTYGVKLRDLKQLGPIYDKLLPDARITMEGQTLSTSELRKHRDKARLDAAKAAREKAEALAAACDAKVGAARSINESTPYGGYYSYRGFSPNLVTQNAYSATGGSAASGDDVSLVGQIDVQATVTVVYDLIPNLPGEK